HRREARLTATAGIEWRDPDEAMNSCFRCEQAVSVVAFDTERGRFYSRLTSRLFVENVYAKSLSLRPTQIHSEEHLRKVLCIGPAGTGLDRADRVVRVRLSR